MKKNVLLTLTMVLFAAAHCQDTVRFPFTCYMEWPRSNHMLALVDPYFHEYSAVYVNYSEWPQPYGRLFMVDKPTTLYGIAGTFLCQDELRRPLRVLLFSTKNMHDATLLKAIDWNDSLPFRYMLYAGDDCGWSGVEDSYTDTVVKSYEFYFDTPVVVSDTFVVAYQTLGIDGRPHPFGYNGGRDSTGWALLAYQPGCCDNRDYQQPQWVYVLNVGLMANSYSVQYGGAGWGGLFPIMEPPCIYDTLTCDNVDDFNIRLIDPRQLEVQWFTDETHPRYQVAVGVAGTDPDSHAIYDAAESPFVIENDWDTAVQYEVRVRALCKKACGVKDTTVWSAWSGSAYFESRGGGQHNGVDAVDGRTRFTLTPNPARTAVTVTIAEPTGKAVDVAVMDAAGRRVRSMTFCGTSASMDMRGLAAGSYIVTLTTSEWTATQRLLIE